MSAARFRTREVVDFVVVGSGAAGGVLAAKLAEAGHSVVVLEQGRWRRRADFRHDQIGLLDDGLVGSPREYPQTFRASADQEAQPRRMLAPAFYARGVGGSSVHFTGNYWRFRPVDFEEKSRLGPIAGTGLEDWPISYDDLEPYYTQVDWEIGVSGAPGPNDPYRSRPYPMPPLPVKSSGVLFERGCERLGWTAQPAPMAILSRPHGGRLPCGHCGYCFAYGCEFGAKSSTLEAMIPRAEATGRCGVRAECTAARIETDRDGRVRRVVYLDRDGVEHAQETRAAVLAANGAETPRLLLMSATDRFPDGLANSSGLVGKYLMFNGYTSATGLFTEPLNEYKSVQVTRVMLDFYDSDPRRGFYGGGGLDSRFNPGPVFFGLMGLPPDAPTWGQEYRRTLSHYFTRCMDVACHSTSLPLETNTVDLDPEVEDRWGLPALRVTYRDHPDDMATMHFFQDRAVELLEAAGAERVWRAPIAEQTSGAHLLGTCRMGTDPSTSVIDPDHRAHDVPNLFICDGSSMVTGGRGQPTMTIQALAFRAADRIDRLARHGEV